MKKQLINKSTVQKLIHDVFILNFLEIEEVFERDFQSKNFEKRKKHQKNQFDQTFIK